jgi:hypothetical protein
MRIGWPIEGREYYAAVAQVIPVLLLVIGIGERRYRSAMCRGSLPWRSPCPSWGFMALGESAALRALLYEEDRELYRDLTAVAIGVGLTFVAAMFADALVGDVGLRGTLRGSVVLLTLMAVVAASYIFVFMYGPP